MNDAVVDSSAKQSATVCDAQAFVCDSHTHNLPFSVSVVNSQLVSLVGFEPTTDGVEARRSVQLSYSDMIGARRWDRTTDALLFRQALYL